ncbi:MAG: GtrA family protein [Actinobacteria bacterium]|nr:GtrA family protein [Actinomycetota bacterium]
MPLQMGADVSTGDAPPPSMVGRLRKLLHDERLRFVVIGGINTAFAFLVFAVLEYTIGHHVFYMVVLLITHLLGVLEAFTLYRLFVFRVKGNLIVDLLRFESVNLGALAVNAALLPLLVEVGHLHVVLAQLIVLAVVTTGTYLAHKHFSFRRLRAAS